MSLELAKAYLQKMLTDPMLNAKLPVSLLLDIGRQSHGLNRKELKAARKELGVVSENIDGVQYWSLPKEET